MTVQIDVTEIYKFASDLETVAPQQMKNAVRKVTIAETKAVQTRAKAAAPRDRPWLASRGIRRRTFTNPDNISGTVYTVADDENRPVGFFVEFGTSKMAPQPFITPALSPSAETYPAAVIAAVDPFATSPGSAPASGGDDA